MTIERNLLPRTSTHNNWSKMHLHLDVMLKCLAILLVFAGSEASVANLLTDRALAKLSRWIETNGSIWLSFPGHFQQGQIHNVGNKFTLAFSGPKLSSIGGITRSGDATLDDAEPDPMYKSCQKLRFTSTLQNVTLVYPNVAYTEDDFGTYNFTPVASTGIVTVEIELDIKGDMETCVGFPRTVNVNFNGGTAITVGDKHTDQKVPAVIGALSSHFKNNVVANLQTLLESGTFNSLDNYDICNDAYNPLLPANMFAEQILMNVVKGLKDNNLSYWAWLPGFWKQFHAPNGTVTNFLRVDVGNFSSIGEIRRAGDASYSNEGNQSITMNFDVDSMTAYYRSIYFTDRTKPYNLSDTIDIPKLSISLSVIFYKSPYSRTPVCNNDTLKVKATYRGGQVHTELQPSLPQDLYDMVNTTVVEGFLKSVEEAASDLFLTAAVNAMALACPKNNVLPPANDIADNILAVMAELLEKHASDWTHLPGSWRQYFAPNGTLIYFITAGVGNFSSAGSMQRISATYNDVKTNLNIVFETDSMSAIYGEVLYSSNWVRYRMVETVKTKKIQTSLSVSFSPQGGSGVPTCYGGSVGIAVSYEGGELEFKCLTPGVPDDIQSLVKSQLSEAFLNDYIGAVEELYNQVAFNALPIVCSHTTVGNLNFTFLP